MDEQAITTLLLQLVAGQSKINERLDGIDSRLDGIDSRLDGIDSRLDGIDSRLDGIDSRLDGIDKRLDKVDQTISESYAELMDNDVRIMNALDAHIKGDKLHLVK